MFTVVAWDQNLSFGGMGGAGGGVGRGGLGAGQRPVNGAAGAGPNAGGNAGGRGGNILAQRFKANTDLNASYLAELAALKTKLYGSGTAQQILDTWTGVLTAQAADLVPTATVASEASKIAAYFTAS